MIIEADIYKREKSTEIRMVFKKEKHDIQFIEYAKIIPDCYHVNAVKATVEDMCSEIQKRILEQLV